MDIEEFLKNEISAEEEELSLQACLEVLSKMISEIRMDIMELQMNIDARRNSENQG